MSNVTIKDNLMRNLNAHESPQMTDAQVGSRLQGVFPDIPTAVGQVGTTVGAIDILTGVWACSTETDQQVLRITSATGAGNQHHVCAVNLSSATTMYVAVSSAATITIDVPTAGATTDCIVTLEPDQYIDLRKEGSTSWVALNSSGGYTLSTST